MSSDTSDFQIFWRNLKIKTVVTIEEGGGASMMTRGTLRRYLPSEDIIIDI